jgi:hypothetical protein
MAVSLALGEIACARPTPQGEAPAAQVTVTIPATAAPLPGPSEAPTLVDRLRPWAVVHAKVARRTLFTWTTREQIDELGRDPTLLTRTESAEHGATHFTQVVAQRAATGDLLAALLATPAFAKSRHAWPVPWATVLGWQGETYGDDLISITLKPDAWIAKLRTSQPGWEVVDLDDRPVELAEALRHPERIAATYFVEDTPGPGPRGTYGNTYSGGRARPAFREYVISNESMIASWSIGTEEIARLLAEEVDSLEVLRRHLAVRAPFQVDADTWNARVARTTWSMLDETPGGLYEAALAFPNDNYLPQAAKLAALIAKLRALSPRGPRIEHRPSVVFPAAAATVAASASGSARKPPPAPPPKKKRRGGTWGTF